MEERAMTAQVQHVQVQQVEGIRSELASELAAVREQEQVKCTTGERLQETLMEERIEKRMGILEGRMSGVSELAAEQDRITRQQHHKTTVQEMSAVAELASEQDRRIR